MNAAVDLRASEPWDEVALWADLSAPAPPWVAAEDWPVSEEPVDGGPSDATWDAPGVGVSSAHPVTAALARVDAILDEVYAVGIDGLDAVQASGALAAAQRLSARFGALVADLVTHAEVENVPALNGSPNAAVWLARATRLTRPAARRIARLGETLGDHRRHLAPALRSGSIGVEQAEAIGRALSDLLHPPGDVAPVDPDVVVEAERVLVGYAADFDARDLRRLGRSILTVVAPEAADAFEARVLDAEERSAEASARFTMAPDGHGKVRGRFTLPEVHGAMLAKALQAYASPHRRDRRGEDGANQPGGSLPPGPQKLGAAFAELIETIDERGTPTLAGGGGIGATVVVTMSLETLGGGEESASLDTGVRLSPGTARRLACEAGLVPLVLGGGSQPLDVGRAARFHTKAQRIAIAHRDQTCTAEGCDLPPHLCHVHHESPWSSGGATSVANGRLLCGHHHRRVHDPAYLVEIVGGGTGLGVGSYGSRGARDRRSRTDARCP